MNKKSIFKDFTILSSGNYISQALGVISGFLLRIFLTPYQMGIWQGLNIIKTYANYTNLGVPRAAAREIAYLRGKGNFNEEEKIKDASFTFNVLTMLLIGLGCFSFAVINKNKLGNLLFWGLIAIGIIIILERTESFIVTIMRSKKKFYVESVAKIFNSALNIILILLLVRKFKLFGLYIKHISLFCFSIFIILRISREKFKLYWNKEKIKHLIKIGIPMLIGGFMFSNLMNVDRIVIVKMLGAKQLGIYSVAIMVGNGIYNISNMFGIVMYPRFQEKYGKTSSKKSIQQIANKTALVLSVISLVIIVIGMIFFPYLVNKFLVKYRSGIGAMKILMIGMFFLAMSIPYSHFLITINKQVKIAILCSVAVVINILLNIFFVKKGFGIEGVAMATSIGYFIYFIELWIVQNNY